MAKNDTISKITTTNAITKKPNTLLCCLTFSGTHCNIIITATIITYIQVVSGFQCLFSQSLIFLSNQPSIFLPKLSNFSFYTPYSIYKNKSIDDNNCKDTFSQKIFPLFNLKK